jgi:pyruvate kinase
MLSAESAMGHYPLEAVEMLVQISTDTEPSRDLALKEQRMRRDNGNATVNLIAHCVQQAVNNLDPIAVMVPTRSGAAARNITRYRLPTWITAFSMEQATCQALQFSYGVYPVQVQEEFLDWGPFCCQWLHGQGFESGVAVLTQGPSPENPYASHTMQIANLACQLRP